MGEPALQDNESRLGPPAIAWFCLASVYLAWLLMCIAHETGHMLHVWYSGGRVTKVVLHPFAISGIEVSPNHSPRFVVWGGFVWGVAIPLLIDAVLTWRKSRGRSFARFFSGFCLAANGGYLGSGFWSPAGDTRTLRQLGDSPVLMLVLGLAMIAAGIWQWHRLDRNAGGDWAKRLNRRDVAGVTIALVVVVVVELVFA